MTAHRFIKGSRQLDEIAEVIGREAVIALCSALGGTITYVPRKMTAAHPIAAAIRREKGELLSAHYYGVPLNLPKAHTRRKRALQLLAQGNMTVKAVALETNYTERHLRRLLATPTASTARAKR